MATKPLTTEAIALTEKKMDMSLDDIIKMSKTNTGKPKKQRESNRNRKPSNARQDKTLKVRQYMESRSTLRQGALAQRRSNFQGRSFLLPSDAARKAMVAPFRNGGYNHHRSTDWNRPRATGPPRRQGNASIRHNAFKTQPQQQQRQQLQQKQRHQPLQREEMIPIHKPKTLDSLFANMKEQRMRAVTRTNNSNAVRGSNSQPRQPWLRGRFGNYRS
ncbi:unnamed protein product [Amaranthus hypochondriacus]